MKLILPALFILLSAPAYAQCVTAADAENGIVVTFENTDVTTVWSRGDNMYEVEELFARGTQRIRYQALYSTYNLQYAPMIGDVMDDAAGTVVDWGIDPQTLPVPSLNAAPWAGEVTEYDAQGNVFAEAKRSIRFAEGTPITVDGCTYDVVTVGVKSVWQGDDQPQLQFWSYMPELGISVIVGWSSTPGNFVETAVISVEAM